MKPIRIATFNLRYGTAEDGPHSWPFRQDACLETIRDLEADVLGLQEVLSFQLELVLQALPGYQAIGVGRDDGISEGEHCPILFDVSRFRALDSGTFWFSEDPALAGSKHLECFHPRICTWAKFGQSGAEEFAVYNLHLDNESGVARERSIEILRDHVTSGAGAVVTGDFNATETDPCIDAMRAAGYRDSFRVVHPDTKSVDTFHGFGIVRNQGKIDYIWVDSSWNVVDASIENGRPAATWPSDHYPVTAVVRR